MKRLTRHVQRLSGNHRLIAWEVDHSRGVQHAQLHGTLGNTVDILRRALILADRLRGYLQLAGNSKLP